MRGEQEARSGEYTAVEHPQFHQPPLVRRLYQFAAMLTWPLVIPLALLAGTHNRVFSTISELLSLLPSLPGVLIRGEFYRLALRRCGRNVVVEFGTVFLYRDISIGDHVLIGRFNLIHHCDFGSHVLTSERCTFLGGRRQHGVDRTDVPMALQPGHLKRIRIGDDSWIGAHAVVMEDVAPGAVVGAGAVVTRVVEPFTVVAGNPAKRLRRRGGSEGPPNTPHFDLLQKLKSRMRGMELGELEE